MMMIISGAGLCELSVTCATALKPHSKTTNRTEGHRRLPLLQGGLCLVILFTLHNHKFLCLRQWKRTNETQTRDQGL